MRTSVIPASSAKGHISSLFIGILLPLVVLLTGCAGSVEYVKQDDPFKGLAPKSERPLGSVKLCLLLTENTNRALEYAGKAQSGMLGSYMAEAEPKRLVGDITGVLITRFGEVVRITVLADAPVQGCNVVMALDLKIELGSMSFQTNVAELMGALADEKGNRLEDVAGSGASMVPFPNTHANFKSAWTTALTKFSAGLDGSEKLKVYVASLQLPDSGTLASTSPARSRPVQSDREFAETAATYRAASPKPRITEEVWRLHLQAGVMIRGKRLIDAMRLYGEALKLAPWWPDGRWNRALLLGELKRYREAITEMNRFLQLEENASEAGSARDHIYQWEAAAKIGQGGRQ